MVGHCLGAAGSIEAVFSIKALTENMVPPTVGYSDEDIENLKEKPERLTSDLTNLRRRSLTRL